jgi:hypothetical protein
MKPLTQALFLFFAFNSQALAVDTAVVYKSGVLVSIFIGFCALIVVTQLVPALIRVIGFFNETVAAKQQKEITVTESTSNQD